MLKSWKKQLLQNKPIWKKWKNHFFEGFPCLSRQSAPKQRPLLDGIKKAATRSYAKIFLKVKKHFQTISGLWRISDEDIMNLEIPTGIPLVYEMDDQLNVLKKYYL